MVQQRLSTDIYLNGTETPGNELLNLLQHILYDFHTVKVSTVKNPSVLNFTSCSQTDRQTDRQMNKQLFISQQKFSVLHCISYSWTTIRSDVCYMQLLSKDCSEDLLIHVSKCTELLCKQTCRDQNTEKETNSLIKKKKVGFAFKQMLCTSKCLYQKLYLPLTPIILSINLCHPTKAYGGL